MKQPFDSSAPSVSRRFHNVRKLERLLRTTHPLILLLMAGFLIGIVFCARALWVSCAQSELRGVLLASIALGIGFGTASGRLLAPLDQPEPRKSLSPLVQKPVQEPPPDGVEPILDILGDEKEVMRVLIETARASLVVLDRESRIVQANAVFSEIVGRKPSDLHGLDWLTTFIPEAERERVRKVFQQALNAEAPLSFECSIDTHSSETRFIQWKWKPFKSGHGAPGGVFLVGLDVTEREEMESALSKSEERYRAIVEDQTELISRFRPDGTLTFVNGAYCRYFGEEAGELLGSQFWHHVPGHERERLKQHIATLDRDHPVSTIEHPVQTPQGMRWQQWTDRAILDGEGRVVELQAVGRDITERKRVEQALVSERSRLYSVLDSLPMFVFLHSADYSIRFANRTFLRTFGEGTGRSCYAILQGRSEPCVECPSHDVLVSQQSQTWEWKLGRTGRTYRIYSHPFTDVDETPLVLQLGIDVTDQKQYEMDLQRSEAELRELSGRLLSAQEEERKRIAGELHDSIGSSLTGIMVSLQAVVNRLGENASSLSEPLLHLISVTEQTIREARRIMTDLRPSMLDDLGIMKTLEWFSRDFQRLHTKIHIELTLEIEEAQIPDPLKITIFRLVQEALHNVAKHSHAEFVHLSLTDTGSHITLVVEDNGDGFVGDPPGNQTLPKGLGLTSMRERTELSGGQFFLETIRSEGTTVKASWPHSSAV